MTEADILAELGRMLDNCLSEDEWVEAALSLKGRIESEMDDDAYAASR